MFIYILLLYVIYATHTHTPIHHSQKKVKTIAYRIQKSVSLCVCLYKHIITTIAIQNTSPPLAAISVSTTTAANSATATTAASTTTTESELKKKSLELL